MTNMNAAASNPAAELTEAILRELPMSDDGTGHIADCGYTHEDPTCGCYSLPTRIQRILAARVVAGGAAADAHVEDATCGWCGEPLTDDSGYTGSAAYHRHCAPEVYGDRFADTTEEGLRCCNVAEPNGQFCKGQMTRRGPEYVCDTCRGRCGAHVHPRCAVGRADDTAAVVERVQALYDETDTEGYEHNGHAKFEGEPECPGCWRESIRIALGAPSAPAEDQGGEGK